MAEATFHTSGPGEPCSRPVDAPDHAAAARWLLDWLAPRIELKALAAVGQRIVRGAPFYTGPARIDATMLERLREIGPFDAEHLPHEIALIEAIGQRCPELPQVACFDTAFHLGMPRVAQPAADPAPL